MASANRTEQTFTAARIQVKTEASFDQILTALRAATGKASLAELNAVADFSESEDQFANEISARYVGKSGFMIFAEVDHGKWIARYGIQRRAIRIILGNPLIAITMLQHDITAGLFAPVELLLTDNGDDDDGASVTYLRPSSLIVHEDNAPLADAANVLDQKLADLVSHICSLT